MNRFEVLYCCRPPQIEDVLAYANVASAPALTRRDVREAVFDADALTKLCPTGFGRLQDSELLLQPFISRDADCSAFAVRRMRTLRAKRASAADLRVELDD